MHAMILAAGRGERMRPLTDHTPKPLLVAGGKPLIVWHIERLAASGLRHIVINHAWLGQKIVDHLGDGSRYGVQLRYSAEAPALETAGGMARALPLLGDGPFLVINGDIWCDWDPAQAPAIATELAQRQAHAWLLFVDNPAHHPDGDFALAADGSVREGPGPRLTYAGVGVYHPAFFAELLHGQPARPVPLLPLLRSAMRRNAVYGARHDGRWTDVGTPQRLDELNRSLGG